MAKMPNISLSMWLFAEKVTKGEQLTLTGFEFEHKTDKGKIIPIATFWGKIQQMNYEGELQIALWNIANYKQLKEQLGEDTDGWINKTFACEELGKKIKMTLVTEQVAIQ